MMSRRMRRSRLSGMVECSCLSRMFAGIPAREARREPDPGTLRHLRAFSSVRRRGPALSANVGETPAPFGITVGRWKVRTEAVERKTMTLDGHGAPTLGGEERSDEVPSVGARASLRGPNPEWWRQVKKGPLWRAKKGPPWVSARSDGGSPKGDRRRTGRAPSWGVRTSSFGFVPWRP